MPVDLSTIPPAAKRKKQPSLKRWLGGLLVFLLCAGFITSWLWPAEQVARGVLFWHCLISLPFVLWLLIFGSRWLVWLVAQWLADGWDSERERDIAAEIQRGQRCVLLAAHSVHLPHVLTSEVLSEQFILPQGVVLPAVVDETTHTVNYQARFNDIGWPVSDRVFRRISLLLESATLRTALHQRSSSQLLTTVLQIDSDAALTPQDLLTIKEGIAAMLAGAVRIEFSHQFGLPDIDNWLDNPDTFDSLLIISIKLRDNISNGDGEAAVALLLNLMSDNVEMESPTACIHRPEQALDISSLNASALQSLQWGGIAVDDVAYLWFAGLGNETKSQVILANSTLKFPQVDAKSQSVNIDMKAGNTGAVSPWLAIALAAGNGGQSPMPQLVMSLSDTDDLPWWLVIHPPFVPEL